MTERRSRIRVKAMLIAPNADGSAHAVTLCPPSAENPDGYHRLIGGSVEFGETHRQAVVREVREELDAAIEGLTYLGVVENFFSLDGTAGHEIVFVYTGRLLPEPAREGAVVMESDGSQLPVVWRSFTDHLEVRPLYPEGAVDLTIR